MADINIVKYTSQSLTATIGDLASGNHGSSYTFWINDYQNNSNLIWGGTPIIK